MRLVAIASAILIAAPALAQTQVTRTHSIDVTGHGRISVPPDSANIRYWLRGEGKTPDEATRAMVEAKDRVESGIRGLLGGSAELTNSDLVVIEVRDPRCKNQFGQPTIAEAECAIVGYLATSQAEVRTANIGQAGTAVGLASRLGARDARLQSFELRDTRNARSEAMTRAVRDARSQAQVLAAAAGSHLGRVLNIRYGSYGATTVDDIQSFAVAAPAPPPPPPPPVEISMKPRPEEISADVSVSYELLP